MGVQNQTTREYGSIYLQNQKIRSTLLSQPCFTQKY